MHERREHPLIDGMVRAAGQLEIADPATGAVVGRHRMASAVEVRDAVQRARTAYRHWRTVPASGRGAALAEAADAVRVRAGRLAELVHRETGATMAAARAEVAAAAATLDRLAVLAPLHRGPGPREVVDPIDCRVTEPRGVAAVITPWHRPLAVAAGLIGAALATGNTVVHKPSERCPQLGVRFGEIIGAGLPRGVLTTVVGDGRSGALLAADPDVDVVAHAGSGTTAQAIAMAAALTGARVIAEPSGRRPLLVDAGVDPAWAAKQAAAAAFTTSGRQRIYLHRVVAGPFLKALVAEAHAVNGSGELPPLADRQLRAIIAAQVAEAAASGARCLTGGVVPPGPGAFYPATVLCDCTPSMEVLAGDAVGPVAPTMVVDSFDDALRAAASRGRGAAVTVLTTDLEHARRAIVELPAGTLTMNSGVEPGPLPSGADEVEAVDGIADDALGYGPWLLDGFTRVKVVLWPAARR